MKKFFNTAGPCRPERHYMVDPLPRLQGVEELIDDEHYFILHAPRQTGKTTYLYALMHKLNGEGKYTALQVNIQEAASGRDPEHAMEIAAWAIYKQAELFLPKEEMPPALDVFDERSFQQGRLHGYLNKWCRGNPKPVVLFIDEVDSLLDDLFLALLRQLRSGFESRPTAFPHSIGLVGLRDVRDYKIRIRPDSASLGTGSPFNVKSKSLLMEGFTELEVNALLDLHTEETGQEINSNVRAEIWRLSQGQPWLTNALADQIVTEVLKKDYTQPITLEHVSQAKEELILRRDTHLDSLVDKLREPGVKRVAEAIIGGDNPDFDVFNDDVLYAADLGLVTRTAPVRFANPIYQEIVPRTLSASFQLSIPTDYADRQWYIKDGHLDMDGLLTAFQKFYRRHSEAWLEKYDFREVGRQLLLMGFLQRIINFGGSVEREMAVGNGRCDLLVKYGPEQFVLELKLRHNQWSEEEGLEQLVRYLSRLDLDHGYMLLFEIDPAIPWEKRIRWEDLKQDGKKITLVGM